MSSIRLYPSGREVPCSAGETVLGALENAGYALPNNCRAGACGECKVKVREGDFDQGMVLDMALSPQEREQGYGLMCMAKPTGDVLEIEWGTDDAQPKLFAPRENVWFTVIDRIPRTPRIIELRLRPLGEPMRFWPGQFVLLGDERQNAPPRSYSIANTPNSEGEIALLITRLEEGKTSRWVHDYLKPGDRVTLDGPYGAFIGDPSVETPVLCLAAGSGLAPILSLTAAALNRGYAAPVTLLFSAQQRSDLMLDGLLAHWQSQYRNFDYRYTLTREDSDDLQGRIPAILPGLFPSLAEHSIYIAGSPEFVTDCAAAARQLGAEESRIHSEGFFDQFVPQAPPQERLMQRA